MKAHRHAEARRIAVVTAAFNEEESLPLLYTRLREVLEDVRSDGIAGPGFRELSMGMTNDFEVAIEEGATIIRVGHAIFGDVV